MGEEKEVISKFLNLVKNTGNDNLFTMLSSSALSANTKEAKEQTEEEKFSDESLKKLKVLVSIPEFCWFMDKYILSHCMPAIREENLRNVSYAATPEETADFPVNKFCRILYFNTVMKARRALK